MNLGWSEVGDVWLDHASRFTLADERRGNSDNGFGTGNAHQTEEEPCELLTESAETDKLAGSPMSAVKLRSQLT